MNDQDALLAAIRDSPDDDLPRLAFADWCDEHGQAERAQFIRAQIEADRLDEADARRLALEDRADELLAGHREEWLGPAGAQTSRWVFRRGFVESAAVECGRFVDCAEEMFRSWPLRHLRLQGRDGDYAEDEGVRDVVRSEWLAKLERLTVYCDADSLSSDGVAALAACPHLASLRELDLNAHEPGAGIGAEGARLLANSPHLRNLTALRLRWQNIGDDGARALAESPLLPRLRLLELSAVQEMTEEGVIALLSSPGAAGLKWLNVEHLGPTAESMAAVVAWGERARPAGLMLGGANGEAMQILGRASWLGGLTDVDVSQPPARLFSVARLASLRCDPGTFCDELCQGTRFDSLRALDLSHSRLEPYHLGQLAADEHLDRLASISFWFSRIGDDGLTNMAGSPFLARLRHLNLRFSEIGPKGVEALASSPHAAGLRSLYLSGNEFGSPGVRALAASPHLTRLRELDLSGVEATNAAVAAVCESFPNLRWLDLSSNAALTDAAADSLSRAGWPLLERLTLCDLPFSDEAMENLRERWGPRVEFVAQDEWR